MPDERLQKIIARKGTLSRRAAERAISEGRVTVNGRLIDQMGARADAARDRIAIDGIRLKSFRTEKIVLLNKPRKVITSKRDPQGRTTVIDLVPRSSELKPVGRLDYESDGLLLLTNHGELANRLTHPRYGVSKVYIAKVEGRPTGESIARLKKGIRLSDGRARFDQIRLIKKNDRSTVFRIQVTEGRNRFIRRMFAAISHPVQTLRRIQIGPNSLGLTLGNLPPGKSRTLSPQKTRALLKELSL